MRKNEQQRRRNKNQTLPTTPGAGGIGWPALHQLQCLWWKQCKRRECSLARYAHRNIASSRSFR